MTTIRVSKAFMACSAVLFLFAGLPVLGQEVEPAWTAEEQGEASTSDRECSQECQEEPAPREAAVQEEAAPEMTTEEALKTIVTSLRNLKELEKQNKLDGDAKTKMVEMQEHLAKLGLGEITSQVESAASSKVEPAKPPMGAGLLAFLPIAGMVVFLVRKFWEMKQRAAAQQEKALKKKKRESPKSK